MTLGIMATPDGMEDIMEVGTTLGTGTCIHTTADGTADGIHIGDTTITTITTQDHRSTTGTNGMEAVIRPVQTECLQAEYPHEAAHQSAA